MESTSTPSPWSRFVDDASPLPDGRVERRSSPAIGARVVRDDELPRLRGFRGDVRVVLGGGAAQVSGPATFCVRHDVELVALETTLGDLGDLPGNARRVAAAVEAARGEATLADDVDVHVAVPAGPGDPTHSWLAAADELAAAGLALMVSIDQPGWEQYIDAALDRELPFSLTGGTPGQAVAALTETARLWGDAADLRRARSWCRSWSTTDPDGALEHLQGLA